MENNIHHIRSLFVALAILERTINIPMYWSAVSREEITSQSNWTGGCHDEKPGICRRCGDCACGGGSQPYRRGWPCRSFSSREPRGAPSSAQPDKTYLLPGGRKPPI